MYLLSCFTPKVKKRTLLPLCTGEDSDFAGNFRLHCRDAAKSPSATQNMLHNLLKVAL